MNKDFSKIPYNDIVRVGQRSLLYSDLFCVSWLLGRFCNYKCSYCWRHGRSDKPDHRPTALVISTLDEIKKQARERGFNSFHFSFSGGEPTLHPGYLEIIEHYCKDVENTNYQSLHMTTNLSVSLDMYKKYAQISKDLHRVSITASWHPEFAKREPFLEKLLYCMENDIQITVNMVMVPERFDELWEDACFFHNHDINVTLKPQSDPTASYVVEGYTPDMLKRMREGLPQRDYTGVKLKKTGKKSARPKKKVIYGGNVPGESMDDYDVPHIMQVELKAKNGETYYMDQAERFNAFNFNKFKDWECSSGYRSIIIREPDGSIKRSYSCHDEPLGYIGKGFKLFSKPKKCITPSCVSSADSKIPKRKEGIKLPLFPRDKTF
jgi:MoaA/NifB/PqqE/SkfB family radical SAM enzyme